MQLRLKKGEKAVLSPHLNQSEIDCSCTSPDCTETLIDTAAIAVFELVRGAAGGSVRVSSGYRCPAHNAAVGGEDNSYHMKGLAMDLVPVKRPWTQTDASVIRNIMKGYGGLGVYVRPGGHISWLHVDAGPERNWTIKI